MRALTLALSLLTPVFIYSQLSSISLTVENTLALALVCLLSLSLFVASLLLGRE